MISSLEAPHAIRSPGSGARRSSTLDRHRRAPALRSSPRAVGADVASKLPAAGSTTRRRRPARAADILEERVRRRRTQPRPARAAAERHRRRAAASPPATRSPPSLASADDARRRSSRTGRWEARRRCGRTTHRGLVLGRIDGDDEDEIASVAHDSSRTSPSRATWSTSGCRGRGRRLRRGGRDDRDDLARAEMIALPHHARAADLRVRQSWPPRCCRSPSAWSRSSARSSCSRCWPASPTCRSSRSTSRRRWASGLAIDYSCSSSPASARSAQPAHDQRRRHRARCATAGRTVVFSGLTVAISLVRAARLPALLPALVRLRRHRGRRAGRDRRGRRPARRLWPCSAHRIDALRRCRHRHRRPRRGTFWHRIGHTVMRRPVPVATVGRAFLLLLGAPFLTSTFGLPDDRVLPPRPHSRQVDDELRADFSSHEAGRCQHRAARRRERGRPATRSTPTPSLSTLDGVAASTRPTGIYLDGTRCSRPRPVARGSTPTEGTWLSVVPVGRARLRRGRGAGQGHARAVATPPARSWSAARSAAAGRLEGVALRPPAAGAAASSPSSPSCCCS